jgi:hypothetical protein
MSEGANRTKCPVFVFWLLTFRHLQGVTGHFVRFQSRMSKSVAKQTPETALDLGRWLGRREAFALIAGRCSAAEAESLRRLREGKQYKNVSPSWEEFCGRHLGASRRHIDRILRLLDEYGPSYFTVAQMTHVTPEEYRAIAPHVSGDGLNVDGAAIALIPENSAKVAAGVADLLKRERPAKGKEACSADLVLKRFDAVADMLGEVEGLLNIDQQIKLAATLRRMEAAAARCGLLTV